MVAQYVRHSIAKSIRPVTVERVDVYSLELRLGGSGGFRVSSGEPAHTIAGPAWTRF
jgi:hypothetical protein